MNVPDTLSAAPSTPLTGEIEPPGDKSISHRAMILGALARGETRIEGLLESLDVMATIEAVRAFGAQAERLGPGRWVARGGEWRSPAAPIDCGNSGTAARLLMGAAAGFALEATFTGDDSLRRRPMARLLEPLCAMGADAVSAEGGRLPVRLRGGGLRGIGFSNVHASAQVKSSVLLAGLRADGPVEVTEPHPSRDHTERLLRAFGCDIDFGPGRARLGERRVLRGIDIQISGDPSSAAFLLVAALIVPGSRVTLRSVMVNPLRTGLLDTVLEMGAELRLADRRRLGEEEVADIYAGFSRLRGVEVPAERAPRMIDEYPILAIAAAFAQGTTRMGGVSELRVKESNRIATIVAGLRACGVEAHVEDDDLIVEGRGGPPPGGAPVAAQGDHRIAMAFLVLGLGAAAPVTVDSFGAIATSFPGFDETMRGLGAAIG
jgi:3-phosphoshikimate 1-carboxyvinyltransferase